MALPELQYLHITQTPDVCGGRPIVRGTRIEVSSVAFRHNRGESVDEMLDAWPHLTPSQVYDALAYYYDHKAEIDLHVDASLDEDRWRALYPSGKSSPQIS